MRKNQLLLFLFCLLVIIGLFFFGKRSLSLEEVLAAQKKEETTKVKKTDDNSEMGINFAKVIEKAKQDLRPSLKDSMTLLEEDLKKDLPSAEKSKKLQELTQLWNKTGFVEIESFYQKEEAMLMPTAEKWGKAANSYALAFKIARDSALVQHYVQNAVSSYEKAKELDPANLNYKIGLASTYIDGKREVMQGVFMLREVVAEDSMNVTANLILGRLANVSGQFGKATKRLEKVVLQDSLNAEAYFYLGEAYAALEEKNKAVSAFRKCKKLINNPAFLARLENSINNILNN